MREQGLLDESVRELEEAYRYDEDVARYPLVRGLLVQGEEMERIGQADGAVGVYERVLAISPRETLARQRWRTLIIARGDRAFTTGDFEGALAAYQEADADEKVATVKAAQRALMLDKVHAEIGQLEERENWDGAAEGYRRLIEADPPSPILASRFLEPRPGRRASGCQPRLRGATVGSHEGKPIGVLCRQAPR